MNCSRWFRAVIAGGVLSFLLSVCSAYSQDRPPVPSYVPSSHPSAEEKLLFESANRERAVAGLQLLAWDDTLVVAARKHLQLVTRATLLSHRYPGEAPLSERAAEAGAKFSLVEENIAMGPSAAEIHEGWMHSPGHRGNILNPEVNAVGIAAIRTNDGLFAVQDFSRKVANLSLRQQEDKVVSLLRSAGLLRATATEDARKTCAMTSGYAGAHVSYIVHFEVTDLSKLPDQLASKVRSRAYRSAIVGACPESDPAGFTRYRLAVMLN